MNLIQTELSNIESQELESLISRFVDKIGEREREGSNITMMSTPIIPEIGFVIKTKLKEFHQEKDWVKGMKVFCNLCHSPAIPAPPLVDKLEILKAIQNDSSSSYKVPLSLSKPRSDVAKDGSVCLVFDACINSRPFTQSLEDEDFKFFLADLAVAWIQEKYNVELDSNFTFPKMISKGLLVPHMIKRAARPVIAEVVNPVKTPSYTTVLEPQENPDYVVIQVHLPLLESCQDAELDLEANRLILKAMEVYFLDIPIPVAIDVESATGATFDCSSKYLHVTMTCAAK